MVVLIWDLDWFYDKKELPNIDCMRLSSYHKQKGHTVALVDSMFDLQTNYDRLYLCGDIDSTPTPDKKILNDQRTIFLGKKFKYFDSKTLGAVITACRPDYLLYDISDEKSNSYTKANFVTFYTADGTKINKRQKWHNTKKGVKRTIVTDDNLWTQPIEEIKQCLIELHNEKNIVFMHPISLKTLIDNPDLQHEFVLLHFSKGTKFKWRNDVGQNVDAAKNIVAFLNILRAHIDSNLSFVPFKLQLTTPQDDFFRLLDIAAIFKTNKLYCKAINTQQGRIHKLYFYISQWIELKLDTSFIEYCLFFDVAKRGLRWFHIINDPQKWTTEKIRLVVELLATDKWKHYHDKLALQWGGDGLDLSVIDFPKIQKYYQLTV